MFLKKTVLLSPEINGRLVNAGEPVVGQRIARSLDYEDEIRDEVLTDNDGRFHFDEVTIKSSLPNNPFDETRIFQSLITFIDGEEVVLWGHSREIEDRAGIPFIDQKLSVVELDLSEEYAHYLFLGPDGFNYAVIGCVRIDGFLERRVFGNM